MERIVAELVRRTDSAHFDTQVLALGYVGDFGDGLEEFATVHVAEPMPKWSMLHPHRLARQIAAIAPDIVHLHSGVLYKASLAASVANVPYQIYTDHGRQNPDPWTNRAIDKLASRRIDVVVAVSDQLRNHLAGFVQHPSRICVVHNGVDTERYSPEPDDGEFRRELGIAPNAPVIGSTGRFEPVKGYGILIEAFARLRASWQSLPLPVLILVGDGTERLSLERATSRLGISDSVHFVGWRGDIQRVSRTFTLFSMSSLSEGTSVSLLEAMSAGVCPVVTDVGGNAAVLGPELKHRLVEAADPDALARALAHALLDTAARERDARVARERVLHHFSLASMVQHYEALYNAACPSTSFHI